MKQEYTDDDEFRYSVMKFVERANMNDDYGEVVGIAKMMLSRLCGDMKLRMREGEKV
jgi:hypothetical protein